MKRILILCLIAITIIACKNQDKPVDVEVAAPTTTVDQDKDIYKGEFIYMADAAVLTTRNEIYAVKIDEKMHELNEFAVPLKKTDFDMVNVVIKGEIVPNPFFVETGEGWKKMMIIKDIIEVTPAVSAAAIAPIN